MESMEIARHLLEQFPDEVIDAYDFHGQIGILVKREKIVEMLRWLRDQPSLQLDHLMALCGLDNSKRMDKNTDLERFEVVYNLCSIRHHHTLRLRAQIPENDPAIDSVTPLWSGADWLERETFDLVGITFTGHADLRRILLPEDWQGHPLQKDYPLKGAEEWSGMEELLDKVEELKKYDFNNSVQQGSRQQRKQGDARP